MGFFHRILPIKADGCFKINKQLFVQYLQFSLLPGALFMAHYTSTALKIY